MAVSGARIRLLTDGARSVPAMRCRAWERQQTAFFAACRFLRLASRPFPLFNPMYVGVRLSQHGQINSKLDSSLFVESPLM